MPYRKEFVWGAFLLRLSLGFLFFFAGLQKFTKGVAGSRQGIESMFKDNWLLPAWSVSAFTAMLPYAELAIGAMLIVGLLRFLFLVLGSLLMLNLAFGMMVAGKADVVAFNMLYVFMFAAAVFASPWDLISLDALFLRKKV